MNLGDYLTREILEDMVRRAQGSSQFYQQFVRPDLKQRPFGWRAEDHEANPKVRHREAGSAQGLALWEYNGVWTWVQEIPELDRKELFRQKLYGK